MYIYGSECTLTLVRNVRKRSVSAPEIIRILKHIMKSRGSYSGQAGCLLSEALALNKQQQYGDSIDFINKVILSNDAILKSGSSLNDIYYLLGNSYERMENYENAAE